MRNVLFVRKIYNFYSSKNTVMGDMESDIGAKVEISTVEECKKGTLFSNKSRHSRKKDAKRKAGNSSLNEVNKKPKFSDICDSLNKCSTADKEKTPSKSKDCPRSRKDIHVDPVEFKNMFDGLEDEIENVLEENAQKNKLTATNVKNILRHVITNEYVLAMVRNTMKSDINEVNDLEEATFEPKLTRSRVKELREKQHVLPWPMPAPVLQAEPATKSLLEEEFSEECSSDEDYKPVDEECPSDEENIACSPKSSELNSSICEKPPSPDSNSVKDDDIDEENDLVIEIPEPEIEPAPEETEADKIALRTRSKLPLNDTPLEAIEASFIAPDITVDMYDTQCDDEEWKKFLHELNKPLDDLIKAQQCGEEPDDPEDDPEYNVLEDDDIPDELDLRFDNTMKVTRKELNALMAEIMESAQLELNECDEDDEEETEIAPSKIIEVENTTDTEQESTENVRAEWMITEERLQLDEQMRMYVQLLTQSYLLSFGVPELNYINVSSKLFLDEIKMFASSKTSNNERSAFYAHNLDDALEIVNQYESEFKSIRVRNSTCVRRLPGITLSQTKQTFLASKVFMYPELLPICSFHRFIESKKAIFYPAEDNLIALGLEQFSFARNPVQYIQSLLLPTKTEYQIKLRIKNSKCQRVGMDNPIKYYFTYKKAPPYPRKVKPFNPDFVKTPREYPPELLPKWMRPYCIAELLNSNEDRPIELAPKLSAAEHPYDRRRLHAMYSRNLHASPLKQIFPILKKYNQKRRFIKGHGRGGRKKKVANIVKNFVIRPIAPKPPPGETAKTSKQLATDSEAAVPAAAVSTASQPVVTLAGQSIVSSISHSLISPISQPIIAPINRPLISAINPPIISPVNQPIIAPLNQPIICLPAFNLNAAPTIVVPATNQISISPSVVNIADKPPAAKDPAVQGKPEMQKSEEGTADEESYSIPQQDSVTINSSNTKRQQPTNKKKNKMQRDLESSLSLLKPNIVENDPKKEERESLFANSYLLRVSEALKNESETYEKFLNTLCKFQQNPKNPVELYYELKNILKKHPALVNDFVAFLKPEQAKLCGKYKEFVILSKIREFIRKVEIHFSNQPQHLLKILRALSQLKQQSGISSAEVLSTLQPLLKNQSHLLEELSSLLPDAAPPKYLMTDFEDIAIPNSDEDNSSIESCEEIIIPDIIDPYGTKDCPCDCHILTTETKFLNRTRHCTKCGIKFIDGRIYIQTGKVLKPAQVTYLEESPPEATKSQNIEPSCGPKSKPLTSANVKSSVSTESSNKQEAKKDVSKSPNVTQRPLLAPSDEPIPSTSKLPYDVIEDTVFPVVTNSSSKKSVPSDFSRLKDVIGPSKNKNSSKGNAPSDVSESPQEKVKWTREEDKLIIYNCQRLGITEKAFQATSSVLKVTSEEVQGRFLHLMNLISQEICDK